MNWDGNGYTQAPAEPFVATIRVPLETNPLCLNKGLHRMAESRLKKQWRTFAAKEAARFPSLTKVDVTLTWFVKVNRTRDEDNMYRLIKSLCDGLIDAGLVHDDAPKYMGKKCRIEKAPAGEAKAYMELRIEEIR